MEEEEEELLQLATREVKVFGNSLKPRLSLIEDLKLSCDICKTIEAQKKIKDMLKVETSALLSEEAKFNMKMEALAKASKLDKSSPKFDKTLNGVVDKAIKSVMPGRTNLKFDLKMKDVKKKKVPMLHFKINF